MDKFNKETRSRIMNRVKSSGTKLEKEFMSLLWKNGIRYFKNNSKYYGKPDLLLKGKKTVIFLDSCFWHGCKNHLRMPQSNADYWNKKINRNQERDKVVNQHYKESGWTVIRLWEHDFIDEMSKLKTIEKVKSLICGR